jgi:hypothetical protein
MIGGPAAGQSDHGRNARPSLVSRVCRGEDPDRASQGGSGVAIGDAASYRHWFTGGDVRLESVQNATDQARDSSVGTAVLPTDHRLDPLDVVQIAEILRVNADTIGKEIGRGAVAADGRRVTVTLPLSHGDADGFFRGLQAEHDQRRVCGLTPTYLALRLLGQNVRGEVTGYEQCPADPQGGSLVSVAGLVWRNGN